MRTRFLLAILLLFALACAKREIQPTHVKTHEPVKPSIVRNGTARVVTLGDSLAYGAGDESGGGIAQRLDTELERRGVEHVKTTNLGVNGAETSDVMQRLKQTKVRDAVANADAVVLSAGANDLFRSPATRDATLHAPLAAAEQILGRIDVIVAQIHGINPRATVFILGAYNPIPDHPYAPMINRYLGLWDDTISSHFEDDPLVKVVPMDDLVTPQRLSRYDHFHPGGAAYEAASQRIADMIV